jgi:hypothetical protein
MQGIRAKRPYGRAEVPALGGKRNHHQGAGTAQTSVAVFRPSEAEQAERKETHPKRKRWARALVSSKTKDLEEHPYLRRCEDCPVGVIM